LSCTTFVHESNARNLSVQLFLISTSKNGFFSILCLYFSSTKLEIRAEQVLPGSKVEKGREERGGRQGGEMIQTMYAHVNK
jgi:hypothetical protein